MKNLHHYFRPNKQQKPQIAIDLTPILPGGDNGGAKLLTIDLIRHFSTLTPHYQYTLITLSRSHDELAILDAPNIRRVCLDFKENRITSTIKHFFSPFFKKHIDFTLNSIEMKINTLLAEHHFDLLFSPFPTHFPSSLTIPLVSVVHDIQFRYYPHFFDKDNLRARDKNFISTCELSKRIICISNFVRNTILENSTLKPEMVKTIYINLPNRFLNESSPAKNENFLLYPANFWQHKNHMNLFSAFKIFRDKNPDSNLKLVCTGAHIGRYETLKMHIKSLELEDWIILPGYVSEREISHLMHTSKALIFPSLYEGFGMPVVEAMAIGKPVLCSNVTSLPEIADDAALFFDPNIPEQIAEAINQIEKYEKLNETLIKRGRQRSQFFADEEQMAREYIKVFEEVINEVKMT